MLDLNTSAQKTYGFYSYLTSVGWYSVFSFPPQGDTGWIFSNSSNLSQ